MEADFFRSTLLVAQGGCDRAASELLDTFRDYLLLVANRRLPAEVRQKEGASDIVQKTMLEACNGIARFDGTTPEELQRWLRKILVRNVIDVQRHYQRAVKRRISRELSLDRDMSVSNDLAAASSKDPSPSTAAVNAEESHLLVASLKQLPEHYQEVLRLRNEMSLTFDEIGARMDRSGEAARKLWIRALEQLKQKLEDSHETD